jgi:hypothetical protein
MPRGRVRLLKKSLAHRFVIPKQGQNTSKPVQNTTKLRFKAPERSPENDAKEFFNSLEGLLGNSEA